MTTRKRLAALAMKCRAARGTEKFWWHLSQLRSAAEVARADVAFRRVFR
jgi:hypothetical protein